MKQPIKKFRDYELEWYTEQELLAMFSPDAKDVISTKIAELNELIEEIEVKANECMHQINESGADKFSKEFGREIVKMEFITKLDRYERELLRLRRCEQILNPSSVRHISNFQEKLEMARGRPIAEIIGRYMEIRQVGNKFTGLCPFHAEKTPSFHIYAEQGQYHCYGCQAHGDVIKFIQEIQGVEFKDAVDILQN